MGGVTFDYMEKYLRGLIPDHQGMLKELEEYSIDNKVPIVQKETGRFLELMVDLKKPMKILELGTAIGYSSILMSIASKRSSKIITIERDKEMVEKATVNIHKYGFEDDIEILEGDCLEIIESIEDKFDIIFMDAGKGHYNHFLPHCLRLLNKDGIIIADNVLFRGMVPSDDLVKRRKITIVKRMRTYLELVSKDKELITSVIPMGDGIAVTKRRGI